MPLFLYKCTHCNSIIEKVQTTNVPPKECKECGEKGTLEKVGSIPSFIADTPSWKKVKDARSRVTVFA